MRKSDGARIMIDDARLCTISGAAPIDARLSALDVRILAILGRHQTQQGFTPINRKQLAEWAQCVPSSIPRSIRKLEQCGYVERASQADARGAQSANVYRVALDPTPVSSRIHPPVSCGIPPRILEDTPQELAVSACNGATPGVTPRILQDTGEGIREPLSPPSPPSSFSPIPPLITTPSSAPNPDSFPATDFDLFGQSLASEPKAKPKTKLAYSAEFEAFWKSWPQGRRENSDKRTAFRRWKDATAGGLTPATIMGAAKHYLAKREVAKEDYRFCVLAEVFLNGKLDAAVEAFQAHAPDDANLARVRLELFQKFGRWHAEWGPRPDGEPTP